MRIGLDFDNTIVSYDQAFHIAALEAGLIPSSLRQSKTEVRDHLRAHHGDQRWTELQGTVYGSRMADAAAFPGAFEMIRRLSDSGFELLIISHKTQWPYRGPRYNLHEAALDWIKSSMQDKSGPLVSAKNVRFFERKEEKIAAIGSLSCDIFVDDLPEILLSEHFPSATRRVLFDPDQIHDPHDTYDTAQSWREIGSLVEACASAKQ